ncbi:unnamed protein product [Larinioides sclopetarius]|uniref:Elongation of very long chain fatty acids protein n=1 Tax=Larinioides sclopetarius TaxID=280406 RepID=A0AAV2ASP0_9ARAC
MGLKSNEASSVMNSNSTFHGTLSIQNKILVKNPILPYSIVTFYILFVVWIGPAIMKHRKPYSLQKFLIVYNFLQAASNLYIAYIVIDAIIKNWDSRCLIKKNPRISEILEAYTAPGYLLYEVKFLDLLDTVLFVLRKKQSQVTFLHVFHHAGMCLGFYWGLTNLHLNPSFYMAIIFAINTPVHVIMYTYYGLSAIGPHMQKYLWWKKHLTRLQIGQLFFILCYMVHGFLTGCEEMGRIELYALIYAIMTLILFLNFYRKYKKQ